jgi:hypothetical protein
MLTANEKLSLAVSAEVASYLYGLIGSGADGSPQYPGDEAASGMAASWGRLFSAMREDGAIGPDEQPFELMEAPGPLMERVFRWTGASEQHYLEVLLTSLTGVLRHIGLENAEQVARAQVLGRGEQIRPEPRSPN